MRKTLGYELGDIPDTDAWFEKVYPDEEYRNSALTAWKEALSNAARTGSNVKTGEYNVVCKNGDTKTMVISGTVLGDIILVIFFDITEMKNLREQLYQIQKMEAIGQLAGGIAHDINNMLSVIIGNTEIASSSVAKNIPVKKELSEIENAAIRSRDIIRQLMAFARRQIIETIVLDLNEVVERSLNMLTRLIGESVDLKWIASDGIKPVKADPGQIEQILVNLCINSRDAIPGANGKITIETGIRSFDEEYCKVNMECTPGEYTMLAVSDNGSGIPGELMDKIFEPFFTTKEVGKGTGLGLPTIYGIIKQNGGFVNVYSEPPEGTTFCIYLPCYEEDIPVRKKKKFDDEMLKGSETILIVEDEESIITITRKILEEYGYKVILSKEPLEAAKIAENHSGNIDLLITDVVMPEMNGMELSEIISALNPGIKCLYMSGYTANVLDNHGVFKKGIHFLQKPFPKEKLLLRVREILDVKDIP